MTPVMDPPWAAPRVLFASSFFDALKDLDQTDVRRVTAFLAKLSDGQMPRSLRAERVHDAADRSIHSLRVTRDLRAIVRVDGAEWLLLFVGRHDRAYAWARHTCVECHPVTGQIRLFPSGSRDRAVPVSVRACAGRQELCRALDDAGIGHDLAGPAGA